MDSVPFTLFFMFCLMGIHETLSMPPVILVPICSAPAGEWPEECYGATYCCCKPEDYPTAETIQEVLKISNVNFSELNFPAPGNREADSMCRISVAKDPIYMIKDGADKIRYVVQDSNIHQDQIQLETCSEEQSYGAEEGQVECQQKTTAARLLLFTTEKTKMEIVDVKLPTSCGRKRI